MENVPELWQGLVSALDQLPEPLAVLGDWDADNGVVLHINPAWTGLTGFTASEILGRPADDAVFDRETDAETLNRLKDATATGRTFRGRVLQAGSDGQSLAVRLRAGPVHLPGDINAHIVMASTPAEPRPDGPPPPSCTILNFGGATGDAMGDANGAARSRQRLAGQLVESRIAFEQNRATCTFPVAHIARDGQVLYANPAFHRLLGFTGGSLIGQDLIDRFDGPRTQALRAYLHHLLVRRPRAVPIIAACRREDGSRIRVRLDWSYATDPAGAVTGLICVATPLDRHGAEKPLPAMNGQSDGATGKTESPADPDTALQPTDQRTLFQAIEAARVWAAILSHRHPEDEEAQILGKIDQSLGEALQALGADRAPHVSAADYYAETGPLSGMVVALVEDVPMLRDSLADLLQSWGCKAVTASRPENAVDALKRAGRLPDMLVVDLAVGIGLDGASAVRTLRRQYGAGLPAVLIADSVTPELEHFAAAVGMRVLRRPVHPVELRSAILTLWEEIHDQER
jgi:PAS domain S-box-containing protein